jgi:ATP adenylyltransferase
MSFSIKKLFILLSSLFINNIYAMEQEISQPYAIEYAPWRGSYLQQPKTEEKTSCVFCSLPTTTNDAEKLILYRGKYCYAALNINSYTDKGHHFLIMPYVHEKYLNNLSEETQTEMDNITQRICHFLSINAHEIRINFNIGPNALATIPNHIHEHIIVSNASRYYNLIDALQNSTTPVDTTTQYEQLRPLFNEPIHTHNFVPHDLDNNSCYYCNVIHKTDENDKNLIIHRNEDITMLFDHRPFCLGDIIIIPNKHYTKRNGIPLKTLTTMRELMVKTYPLLLTLLNISDINLGMISYGDKADNPQHIRYQITPRIAVPHISPITHINYIHGNVMDLYLKLVEKCNELPH